MKILLATDGSDYSLAAAKEVATEHFRSGRDELLIVSAYEEAYPIAAEPFAIASDQYERLAETLKEQARGFAEDAKAAAVEIAGSDGISTEILAGNPARAIVERANEWEADMIVVGSHGRGFWGRMLGSVSDGVAHHAPCSVLVVRPKK